MTTLIFGMCSIECPIIVLDELEAPRIWTLIFLCRDRDTIKM